MERKSKILIVDDIDINREILVAILEDKYECLEAVDGEDALKIIEEKFFELSLILLDLMMPGIDGFTVLKVLNEKNITNIPIIIITANSELEREQQAFSLGAVDFIPKPFDANIVHYRVDAHVKLKQYQTQLEEHIEEILEKTAETWASITQAMAEIIEYRNLESGQHIKRTSILAKMIVLELNKTPVVGYYCTTKEVRYIYEAASLHDIGKIGIPDNVLLKPGKLTDEEYELMKKHTIIGEEMAQKVTQYASPEYSKFCMDVVVSHHEKWDGTGYPKGLSGTNIPLAARIVSIADTYDAITNDRPYRKGNTHESAMEIIQSMSGKQFDPYLVEVFTSIGDQVKEACIKLIS